MEALTAVVLATTLLISPAVISRASAETYTVGDGEQWSTGVNYLTWSEKRSYVVGDVLLFSYPKDQHDACEVTEETYRSCNSSAGGVVARYATGQDRVALTEARNYWFICSTEGHCAGGMKFGITVRGVNATATAPAGSRPAAPPPAPPGSTAGARPGWWRTGVPCLLPTLGFLLYSVF